MEAPVNSRAWWEDYFAHHWREKGGGEQTRGFMQALISYLPAPEFAAMSSAGVRVLDWGCAMGEGVRVLKHVFREADVAGLDYSRTAVSSAHSAHPDCEFHHTDGSIPGMWDVIVTPNCLEHYERPVELVREHLRHSRSLYMLLVPLDEEPLERWHRYRFSLDSFPEDLGGFRLLERAQVTVDPLLWNGPQILAIYGSCDYVCERGTRVSANTELRRLQHANEHKERVLASMQKLLQERDRGIQWLRGELEIARRNG